MSLELKFTVSNFFLKLDMGIVIKNLDTALREIGHVNIMY